MVVSYILFLLTAYAIGSCHLIFSPEKEPTGICQSFNLKAVQVIMGLVIAVKLLHHIVSIYNYYHHTSTPSTYPQTISSIESEAMVDAEVEEGDGVMDKLSSVDQNVMEGW